MKKISKYVEFLLTKIQKVFKEKNYFQENVKIKYLLETTDNSRDLIVVFSACTRKGIKARYNYVRTLGNIKCNKLFILDDFAADHRGAYYLGENMGNEIERACLGLITKIREKLQIERGVTVGSSKGGWAALNIMSELPGAVAVVGAPQYLLANYLLEPALITCREYVMPSVTEENTNKLNSYLRDKLKKASTDNHYIYLHYSDNEHTFGEHVQYLLSDLETLGLQFETDCGHYPEHWDVSKYYPEFLVTSLQKLNIK